MIYDYRVMITVLKTTMKHRVLSLPDRIVKGKALNNVNAASVSWLSYGGWHLSKQKVKEEKETWV